MNFSRKNVTKFPTPCNLSSERDILTNLTSNQARSKPMETRYPELSKDIKFEKIRVGKGLQIEAQKSDQKAGK